MPIQIGKVKPFGFLWNKFNKLYIYIYIYIYISFFDEGPKKEKNV